MSKNVIFCFSGTGNCLDMAKNIGKALSDTDIIMMRSEPEVKDVRDADRVGFVFPCYGGGAPSDVLRYAKMLKIRPDAYTFAVSQSASYAGTGLKELNRIVPLRYWRAVTHQCSCIWLFPHQLMIPLMTPKMAQKRSERISRDIAKDVLNGKKTEKKPPFNPLNAAENRVWPMIEKKKADTLQVSDACIGCGQCEKLCPRKNIRMENGHPVFGSNCVQCLGCLQYCPAEAIHMGSVTTKRRRYHNPNVTAADLMQTVIHI